MTDHAEREAKKQFTVALARALEAHILCYSDAEARAVVADAAEAMWRRAVLASARERVEAARKERTCPAPCTNTVCVAVQDAFDAAARAITEAT